MKLIAEEIGNQIFAFDRISIKIFDNHVKFQMLLNRFSLNSNSLAGIPNKV